MNKKIVINPFTRISGMLEISVEVDDGRVCSAYSSGLMFRGFELMLKSRNPLDVSYFTERICGICSTAHSMASTIALENSLGIEVSEGAGILRNIIHGCEFLQNHIRHFYLYSTPDYVKGPDINPVRPLTDRDYKLPEKINIKIVENYFKAIEFSRMAHEMLAVFGGKAPHNHGIAAGGVSVEVTSDKIIKFKSILQQVKCFIDNSMVPDVYNIAQYYYDCFTTGKGPGNFLSYGAFDNIRDSDSRYLSPIVYIEGKYEKFDAGQIEEYTGYSWFNNEKLPDPYKENAYSWVKAVRYKGRAMEVGPLARMWLSGRYRNGISTMDRVIARVLEAQLICNLMMMWICMLRPGLYMQKCPDIPDSARGECYIDTTRGALMHSISIKDKAIDDYRVITPTMWNCSPRDDGGQMGTIEQALIGIPAEGEYPVEVGRAVRSFDPCISCGTHLYRMGRIDLIEI